MLKIDSLNDSRLAEIINRGKVGVMPSDTIYGLVCSAKIPSAVEKLYKLKSREKKPGTIIAANIGQLVGLGIPKRYLTAVEQFWPNPISIEIPTTPEMAYLDQGTGRQALRVVKNNEIKEVLLKTGPLLTSSANLPGQPPANNIVEAMDYFGDNVDFYVDGGDMSDRPASTIIRIVDDAVEVFRQGAIKINEKGEIVS